MSILEAKQQVVNEISGKFNNAQSAVVVEYRGLTVAQVTELRRNLRAEGVEYKVYKNSLSQRAAEACGYGDLVDSLTGPNAIAFGSDAVAPARILAKFAKKHDKLVIKGGIVEGKIVSLETINELAGLPNRDGMIAMLLGCLQAPMRDLALTIKALAEKDGSASE